MIGRTNASGGVGGAVAGKGQITVEVEAGAIVTCSNGTVTKVAVSNGSVTFYGLDMGTWTVEATLNGQSASEIVELEHPTIALQFGLVLYKNGDNTAVTGGWKIYRATGEIPVFITDNGSYMTIKSGTGTLSGSYLTMNAIDLTNHKTLEFVGTYEGAKNGAVIVMPSNFAEWNEWRGKAVALADIVQTGTPTDAEPLNLDVSELSGSYLVGVGVTAGSGMTCTVNMASLILR